MGREEGRREKAQKEKKQTGKERKNNYPSARSIIFGSKLTITFTTVDIISVCFSA